MMQIEIWRDEPHSESKESSRTIYRLHFQTHSSF